ncbi:MAG: hypothetical protein NWE83_11815 [Candidatus Bathyarchaeota archaeon]|nr:hypothetical protein [Candidatus Bathyarchaeota archaeon]
MKEAVRRMKGSDSSKDPGIFIKPYSEGGRETISARGAGSGTRTQIY